MKPQPSDVSISGVVRLPGHLTAPFREFNSQELPLGALAILSLLTTMYAIPTVGSFAFSFDEDKSRTQIALVKVTGALNILVIMLSWLTLYFRYYEKHSPKRMTAAKRYMGSMVQNLYSIVLILSLAVRLCARMAYGECNGNSILEQAFCNPNHSTHGLPEDTLVVVVWSPIMFPMILRDTDWIAVILHWLIATIAVIFCVIDCQQLTPTTVGVAFIIPIYSGIAIYSNQLQNVRSFVIQQQLAAVIKQNEEMAEELRANELRHMIGNVAHDLKTPLASFVSGLDMVADIAQDGLRKLSSVDNCCSEEMALYDGSHYKHLAKEVRGWLEGVLCSVQNSRNVNNFMMMTINRCIDYTKASKGLKLVPKYETIELMETLSLPFKCMKDVSQKVHVHLEELSKDICSHVITDKQWLQENILCLLSNAVKYSAGGNVNGRVSLKRVGEIGPGSVCQLPVGLVTRSVLSLSDFPVCERPSLYAFEEDGCVMSSPTRFVHPSSVPSTNRAVHSLDYNSASDENEQKRPIEFPKRSDNLITSGDLFLLVEIEDTGIGLTEEGMATLFNAFKQAQKLAGGTGLGLFSLARRVEALGGSYGVRKRLDGVQGSVFWFTIPYRPDAVFAEAAGATTTLEHTTPSYAPPIKKTGSPHVGCRTSRKRKSYFSSNSPTSKSVHSSSLCEVEPWRRPEPHFRSQESDPLTILIVDDAPSIQKMMSMMLRRHGHDVDQADNGASGLSLVTSTHNEIQEGFPAYDVVLMDLQMPVMDGLEATRRIREAEQKFAKAMSELVLSGCSSSGGQDKNSSSIRVGNRKTFVTNLMEKIGQVLDAPPLSSLGHSHSIHTNSARGRSDSVGLDSNFPVVSHARTMSVHLNEQSASFDVRRVHPTMMREIHQFIIGVSANSDTDTMNEAFAAGVDAFISKPFSIDVFYQTYNQHCNGLKYVGSRVS